MTAADLEKNSNSAVSLQYAHRLSIKERANVVHHAGEIRAIVLNRNVAQVRREHHIVHLAQGMIGGQRLHVKDVEAGTRNLPLAQRGQQGSFLYYRAA